MVEVTNAWLHQHASNPSKTAWTGAQFKILGVSWPPVHGWKRKVLGRQLTEEQADAFAAAATTYSKRTQELRRKDAQRILDRSWPD